MGYVFEYLFSAPFLIGVFITLLQVAFVLGEYVHIDEGSFVGVSVDEEWLILIAWAIHL
jgi:hypothetical protein